MSPTLQICKACAFQTYVCFRLQTVANWLLIYYRVNAIKIRVFAHITFSFMQMYMRVCIV